MGAPTAVAATAASAFNDSTNSISFSNGSNGNGSGNLSSNPFDHDEDLQRLMANLEDVQTLGGFRRWRKRLLRYLESYVRDGDGKEKAAASTELLNDQLAQFNSIVDAVHGALDSGALSVDSVSVKGRLSLHKMNLLMHQTTEALDRLVPRTAQDEIDLGYDKFRLASVLIGDNFRSYRRLTASARKVAEMREGDQTAAILAAIADRQLFDRMASFQGGFERFCAIQNDLGVHRIMLEAARWYGDGSDDGDDDEEEEEDDTIIFIDLKSGQIGELFRDECVARNLLTFVATATTTDPDNDGSSSSSSSSRSGDDLISTGTTSTTGMIREAARGKGAREALLRMVLEKLQQQLQ